MANVNPAKLQKILFGIGYPVGKDQIVSHAKSAGADSNVLSLLNKLPNEGYQAPADIGQALDDMK